MESIHISGFHHNDNSYTRVWFESSTVNSDTSDLVFVHDTEIYPPNPNEFLKELGDELDRNKLKFARPLPGSEYNWIIDLDLLRGMNPKLELWRWLVGQIQISPKFRNVVAGHCGVLCYDQEVRFRFDRKTIMDGTTAMLFPELIASIADFRQDFPDPDKCAFIMMRFEKTRLHFEILEAIRLICSNYSIQALRADDHIYSDQVWNNVRTYMHGCKFGIVVFERLTMNEFNPNISLETGYMMAQGKSVCLLKDATLPFLHTDLVGHLYSPFDPQNPRDSIPEVLEAWLKNKRLI